jgi:hypothetical protein
MQDSVGSLDSFPSMFAQGLTQLPGRVAVHKPLIRRWNAGTSVGGPRTQHTPQHLTRPPLNPTRLPDKLTLHSACRGLMGPCHCVMQLQLLAMDEAHHADGALEIQRNSLKLLNNLKRRSHAEGLLRVAKVENEEWEKRYWLNELLSRRAERAVAQRGVSVREHAAAVEAASASAAAGAGSGGPSLASLASGHSFVAQRLPLPAGAASVHSSTPRTTYLPPERLPRRPALSQSQRSALKLSSRATQWEAVLENGEAPPQPAPHCPPRLASTLPPSHSSGAVAVANPAALAALGLAAE